jgi:hypothetical protein
MVVHRVVVLGSLVAWVVVGVGVVGWVLMG